MRGIAHGWTPSRIKNPPSREVAEDFVRAGVKRKASRRAQVLAKR